MIGDACWSGIRSDVQHGFSDVRTALIWAAENGRTECVRLLLEGGANKEAKQLVRATIFPLF